jgi:hypothetical protein
MKERVMKRAVLFVFILVFPVCLLAQGSTFHVFPQVADGKFSDGTTYYSLMSVSNTSSAVATCTLATSAGLPVSRFAISAPRTLGGFMWTLNGTQGNGAFASGYATLTCTAPVQASLMYVEAAPDGSTAGMASVFSAPPVTYAAFPLITGGTLQYGIAIANTSAAPITVTFTLNLPNLTSTTASVQVPAQSQFVRFLNQVMALPSTAGSAYLEMGSASPFSVTALVFDGAIFSTVVPAMVP